MPVDEAQKRSESNPVAVVNELQENDENMIALTIINLFFDQSFEQFADEIYTHPKWPENPLFYVCAPSVTDPTVAPAGKENLFVLIPVAPGLEDNETTREHYYKLVLQRLEKLTGQSIREHVIYKRSFAHNDFMDRYNSYKGNAYGLANTLLQTAISKPCAMSYRAAVRCATQPSPSGKASRAHRTIRACPRALG